MIETAFDNLSTGTPGPILILGISNGAGHMRAAHAIAEAIKANGDSVVVVDIADYMTRTTRLTHVTAYLWLVKNTPRVWDRIDRYQKRQTRTSPDWYYRRGCKRVFQLAKELRPSALVATEVGCCEIAALIKRDLKLDVPLVGVNVNYDADRAWSRPEVDLYVIASEPVRAELISFGISPRRIEVWGVPMAGESATLPEPNRARAEVCRWLELDPDEWIVLVAGGGEGIGPIKKVIERLMCQQSATPQIIVLTGKNQRLQRSLDSLRKSEAGRRLRVLSWTNRIAELMQASDLFVSKLGNSFDEAIAAELPIVALEPPPGSERVQYKLLDEWGIGCAVHTLDEMADTMASLLEDSARLKAMRKRARGRRLIDAADRIAQWLKIKSDVSQGYPATSKLVVNA